MIIGDPLLLFFFAVLAPLVDRLREFKQESSTFEAWLKGKEVEFEECGTIGANLERCQEQTGILEVCMCTCMYVHVHVHVHVACTHMYIIMSCACLVAIGTGRGIAVW